MSETIERLRECATVSSTSRAIDCRLAADELEQLKDELERLKAELYKVREELEGFYEMPGMSEESFERFHERYTDETDAIINGDAAEKAGGEPAEQGFRHEEEPARHYPGD